MTKSKSKLIIALVVGVLLVLFIFKTCSRDNKNRERLRQTTKICDSVYVETYLVFGQGALGTDLVSDWLTDQKNFRIYIGIHDEGKGGFWYECKRDSIFVRQKFVDDETGDFIRDSLVLSSKLVDLKKKRNFTDD